MDIDLECPHHFDRCVDGIGGRVVTRQHHNVFSGHAHSPQGTIPEENSGMGARGGRRKKAVSSFALIARSD